MTRKKLSWTAFLKDRERFIGGQIEGDGFLVGRIRRITCSYKKANRGRSITFYCEWIAGRYTNQETGELEYRLEWSRKQRDVKNNSINTDGKFGVAIGFLNMKPGAFENGTVTYSVQTIGTYTLTPNTSKKLISRETLVERPLPTLQKKIRKARQAAGKASPPVYLAPGGGFDEHGWISMDGREHGNVRDERNDKPAHA